jgi:hypothetical protein
MCATVHCGLAPENLTSLATSRFHPQLASRSRQNPSHPDTGEDVGVTDGGIETNPARQIGGAIVTTSLSSGLAAARSMK